jgi:hypothetical protein
MAKKKAAKKSTTKRMAKTTAKKAAPKKKAASKKKAAKKAVKKASRSPKSAKKTARSKKPVQKTPPRSSSPKGIRPSDAEALKATQRLEKITITIEPQESGDLVVTESGGGTIQIHHTIHPGADTTPIPGKSYDDLHELGPGTHEIDMERTIGSSDAVAQTR